MDKKLLSKKEVSLLIGIGLVGSWRWKHAGDFPARIKICASGWLIAHAKLKIGFNRDNKWWKVRCGHEATK